MKKLIGVSDRGDSGSVLVLFCLTVAIVFGVVSHSLYMAYHVEQKIELYNSADSAALAAGGHVSQGLNMISANNLSIGAAMHVASAVPVVAAYSSLAYSLTSSVTDAGEDLVNMGASAMTLGFIKVLNRYQKKIWNPLAKVTSFYIRIGTGLTAFNKFLEQYWLIPAYIRAVEQGRLNRPDAVILPMQNTVVNGSAQLMTYLGLKTASAKDSFCHTLKASEGIEDRQDFWVWLSGPLQTMGPEMQRLVEGIKHITTHTNKYLPMRVTYVGCGYGIESGVLAVLQSLTKAFAQGDGVNQLTLRAKAVNKVGAITRDKRKLGGLCRTAVSFSGAADDLQNLRLMFKNELGAQYLYYESLKKWQEAVRRHPEEPRLADFACRRVPSNRFGALDRWFSGAVSYRERSTCETNWRTNYQSAYDIWKTQRSAFYCKEVDGKVLWDHVERPPKNPHSSSRCMNLRTMDPECALSKYVEPGTISSHVPGCGKKIKKRIKKWKQVCRKDFDNYDEVRDGATQMVDWGKQLETYMNGRETGDQLGFMYIADRDRFSDSTNFVVVAASAARTPEQLCPAALLTIKDGNKTCRVTSMPSLVDYYSASGASDQTSDTARDNLRLVAASARQLWLSQSGVLHSSWQRSQWVVSGAKSEKKQKRHATKLELFWPDWRPVLTRPADKLYENIVGMFATEKFADALSVMNKQSP